MDSTFITVALEDKWNVWNVRGMMILSLCMQLILAQIAPFRPQTSHRLFIFVVWSAYLLSDWSALFVFGLISNAGCRNLENTGARVPADMMTFWAAFLLIHLGGPDTITAFSMEDNALWMRQLISLIAQVSIFLYIFVKTLPNNRLLVPTILLCQAGVINYGERTRALYLASLENLKKTLGKPTAREREDYNNNLHHMLKGFIVDVMPDLKEYIASRGTILDFSSELLLYKISRELNLLYEMLYTKIKAANSNWGKIARVIHYNSTFMAFILFCLVDKHQYHRGDLAITYALFAGVLVLHVSNLTMIITSPFQNSTCKDIFLLGLGQGIFPPVLIIALVITTSKYARNSVIGCFFKREWSKKVASYNILSHCFEQSAPRKCHTLGKSFIWNMLARERHVSWEALDNSLWIGILNDIKGKARGTFDVARMKELYEARGDKALEESRCNELMPYIRGFQYDNTLLIWHIATEIFINVVREEDNDNRNRIKKLSDYMMFLLVRRQNLMSAVAGISQFRYKDTCDDLKLLGRKFEASTMQDFCESILKEHANNIEPVNKENNSTLSVLKDSCKLVQLLRENNNRWEIIYTVWLELLLYTASHCGAVSHVRQLSEGGEFITVIWMLTSLCGIGPHVPPDQGTRLHMSPAGRQEDQEARVR